MKAVLKAFGLLVAIMAIVMVVTFIWIGSRGISAKAQTGRVETVVARTMRRLAIPRFAQELKNPVGKSPEVLAEGIEQMKALNPRSPEEVRQAIEEEKFLQGGSETPKPRTPTHTHKH